MTLLPEIFTYLIAVVILILVVKLLSLPIKLIYNAILGGIGLWLFNFVAAFVHFQVSITIINSLIVGFFGVPGLVAVIFLKLVA
ncbi:pro-sigmaK processing inhibitor BofA family protein [Succinispira mobilis]|uniref:pro-sigmaK processing inhibitor BofA family protein n=1 Tax=Succinispira mobilis TaxID=78120 RepID=UPI0012E9FE23